MHDQPQYMVRLRDGREFGPAAIDVVQQWAREGRVPNDAMLVAEGVEPVNVLSHPELASILNAPPTIAGSRPATPKQDDGLSGLIPYRNPPALTGYYISIVSLVPLLGAIAGPVAIGLGVVGLRKVKALPECRGTAHAWIAIVLGIIGTLISITCLGSMVIAALAK